MWGCFCRLPGPWCWQDVFPTHVGVFPMLACIIAKSVSLPHACGGVSEAGRHGKGVGLSSPRMWGCFWGWIDTYLDAIVFPTHVGVFPGYARGHFGASGLPHACGGVSDAWEAISALFASSPRMWGCFWDHFRARIRRRVFPTHVGVFPIPHRNDERRTRLPHACGGVSYTHLSASESSMVFPTHVGVFLA